MKKNLTRRQFGKNLSGLGLSALTINSIGLSGLFSSSAAMAQATDYKALVYVYLFGGNDSFNMVVPKESGVLRSRYEDGRGIVALPARGLHSLNATALISSGETYDGLGMHANCGDLAGMFNSGELGILNNVGNLIEPTDRDGFFSNASQQLPPQLFSHADQSRQLLSEPISNIRYGWGGRVAEILADANSDTTLSPLVSTAGLNPFQLTLNRRISTYSTGTQGPSSLRNNTTELSLLDSFMRAPSFDLFSQRYREVYDSAVLANSTVGQAFNIANSSSVDYDGIFSAAGAGNTSLGNQLKAIAKLIAGREASTNNRPIYFVRIGGFDQHTSLLEDHAERMQELNDGLKGFRDALVNQGDFNNTLTHIGSEFGRTFTPNSSGTDHGWGGNMMVMGGAVNGGKMFGRYPDLVLGGERDADRRSRGRWIPQTSTHQTAALISSWFGVQPDDISGIFPTLSNFDDPFGVNENLDFINQGGA